MTKEKPILYSTAMAKAKVEMRKTQTRRVVKFPADFDGKEVYLNGQFGLKYTSNEFEGCIKRLYPKWQPGDLLWGRESVANLNIDFPSVKPYWVYKADVEVEGQHGPITWTPSIHMPKAAARIWDEVISVRVERVADISEADCIAEGIEWKIKYPDEHPDLKYWKDYQFKERFATGISFGPKQSYRSLWQLINGTPKPTKTGFIVYPFDAICAKQFEGMTSWKGKPLTVVVNPWVWVIETKQLSVTGKPLFKKLSAIDGTAM